MRKQFITWLFFCLALVSGSVVRAQTKDFTLKIEGFRGEVQWEQSDDHISWQTVNGAITGTFVSRPTKTTYYRARITEEGCTPVYSGIKAAVTFNDTMYAARLIKGKVEIPSGSVIKPADCIVASVLDTTLITETGVFELLVPDSAEEFTLVASTKEAKLLMLGHFVGQKDQYVINTEESALAILLLFPGLKPIVSSEKPAFAQLYKKEPEFLQLVSQVSALQMQGKPLFENMSDQFLTTVQTLVKKSFNGTRMRAGSTQILDAITIRSHNTSSVAITNTSSASYTGQFYNQDGQKVGQPFNLAGKMISDSKLGQLIIKYFGDPNRNTTKTELLFDLKSQLNLPVGQYEIRLRNGLANDGSNEDLTAIAQNFVELVILSLSNIVDFGPTFENECFQLFIKREIAIINPLAIRDAVEKGTLYSSYVYPILKNIADHWIRAAYGDCEPKLNKNPNKFYRGLLDVINFLDKYGEPSYYIADWVLSKDMVDGCQYLDKNFETSDCFQLLSATSLNNEYMAGDTVMITTTSKKIKKYFPFSDEGVPFKYFDWEAKDGHFIPGNKTTVEGRTLINNMDSIRWVLPCDFVMADANATIPGVKSTAATDMFFTKVYVPELKLVPSGNKQEESVSKLLPSNLSIQLLDTFRNVVFAPDNYTVTWELVSGKGKIEPIAPANTSAKWTLGTEEGEQKVKVTVKTKNCDLPVKDNSFIFSATALSANSLQVYSGNKQVARPTAYLKDPIKVLWKKADGTKITNGRIDWVIESGGGSLDNATSYTDNDGIATNSWRLGTTGIQKVKVTAKKEDGTDTDGSPLYFEATFGEPYILYQISGDNQEGIANTALNAPLEVQVNNVDGNPLPGVLVNWSIVKGNGQLTTMLGITNLEGRCSNNWTLGASGEQQVKASVKNSSNQEILFSPTSFNAKFNNVPNGPSVTTASGCPAETSINIIGNVTNQGGSSVTTRGVCWSTNQSPTITNSKTSNGSGVGTFVGKMTGLTPNTTYYVRAYATNSAGTTYGNQVTIVTTALPPVQLQSVTIGTQVWAQKNLDVVTYCNGDTIPEVKDPTQWSQLKTGAWCYFNNDPANNAAYGKLYNWYAVNDPRGLAPPGWHVPTNTEYATLISYLGGADVAGRKLKDTTRWADMYSGFSNNSSGFAARPGGYRNSGGGDGEITKFGMFWMATEYTNIYAWVMELASYNVTARTYDYGYKPQGFSVRCVKD